MNVKRFFILFLTIAMLIPASSWAIKVGDKLPAFKGVDMKGHPVDLTKVIGKKPVALVFWTTWCPDSRRKLLKVNELVKKWRHKGLVFVGINAGMNDSEKKAAALIKELKIDYPTVFDKTGALSEKYTIKKLYCMIVAAKDGTVMMVYYDTVPVIDDNNFLVLKTYKGHHKKQAAEEPEKGKVENEKKAPVTKK